MPRVASAKRGGLSPSPPRSGGEGWGEVAPSLVAKFFFHRVPGSGRVPQTAECACPRTAGLRPAASPTHPICVPLAFRGCGLGACGFGIWSFSFGPFPSLHRPPWHGMLTLAIIRPCTTSRPQGGPTPQASKYDANHSASRQTRNRPLLGAVRAVGEGIQ